MDCFIFEIQRTLYSNNRNYVLTYANIISIYNRLLLNILYVINQKYGLNL